MVQTDADAVQIAVFDEDAQGTLRELVWDPPGSATTPALDTITAVEEAFG